MILYHGSKVNLSTLESRQATTGGKTEVPEGELLSAIYFTPKLSFAIACAARPYGGTDIDDDKKTIEFENPELFNPDQDIYIYEINSENIPTENLREVDEKQYAVEGLSEVKPDKIEHFKAEEVLKYYDLTNWKRESSELKREFKLR